MMMVPLMVVASKAVGLARSGKIPNTATQTMTMRPSNSCLHRRWSEIDDDIDGITSHIAMHSQ
jgi:hypothetical protein